MRLLLLILSAVWAMFAWVCFASIRWQPPMEAPDHALQALQSKEYNAKQLNESIESLIENQLNYYYVMLNEESVKGQIRADFLAKRAELYWLSAFLQKTYVKQVAYLRLSQFELEAALQIIPDHPYILYCLADVHHILKEYDKAEPYYLRALRLSKRKKHIYKRYTQMLEESGFENKYKPKLKQKPETPPIQEKQRLIPVPK